jgi:hypothetical protein
MVSWIRRSIARIAAVALVALAVALVSTQGAAAAKLYAAPAGDGSPPCPAADPCGLGLAVATALGGDEVTVLPGAYATSGLVIAPGTRLSGPGPGAAAVISGDGTSPAISAFGTGTLVRDVTVRQSGFDAALEIGEGATADRVIATASGAGPACSVPLGGTVRDSLCHARFGNGVMVEELDPVSGLSRLVNVTAVSEGDEGVGAALLLRAWTGTGISVDATNTIAAARGEAPDVAVGALEGGTAALAMRHSNFATVGLLGSGATATAPDVEGNQAAEPEFADAAAGDFSEGAGSPTVDAGTADVNGLGALDLASNARVIGPAPDIGAYELDPEPVTPVRIRGSRGRVRTERARLTVRFRLLAAAATGFRCSLDGAAASPCDSPVSYRLPARRNGGERHVLRVRAVDRFGNHSLPAVQRFRIVRVR